MAKKKKHPDDASATSKNSRGTVKTVGTVDSENLSDEKLAMLAGLPQKEARSDEESESGNSDSEAGDEEVSMLQDEESMTLGTLGSEGVHVDDSLTLDGGDSLSLGSSGKSPGNKKKRGTMAIDTAANPTSPKKGGIMSIFGKGPKVFDKLPSPSPSARRRMSSIFVPVGGFFGGGKGGGLEEEIEPYMPALKFRERMDRRYENAKRRKHEVAEDVDNAGHRPVAMNIQVNANNGR